MQQLLVIVTLRVRHAVLPRAFARRGQRLFQTSTTPAPCLGLSQLPSARGVSVTAAAASARITPFAPPHREALPSASRGRHAAGPPGALAPQLDHHGAARVRGRGGQRAGRRRRRRPPVVARAARLREPVRATVRTAAAPHAGTLGTARRTSQHHLYSTLHALTAVVLANATLRGWMDPSGRHRSALPRPYSASPSRSKDIPNAPVELPVAPVHQVRCCCSTPGPLLRLLHPGRRVYWVFASSPYVWRTWRVSGRGTQSRGYSIRRLASRHSPGVR